MNIIITIAQLEFLSEETHSQNKVAFGLEYKTKQMASPPNNVLNNTETSTKLGRNNTDSHSLERSHR